MKAIISDIHANLEALCNVCEDIEKHNVDEIICLGDIVGYGADSEACTDIIMDKVNHTIMGNHDYALINGPEGFNPMAADVIFMTRDIMLPHESNNKIIPDCFEPSYYPCLKKGKKPFCFIKKHSEHSRWKFLEKLPTTYKDGQLLYFHGSVFDPINEYTFPDKFERWWNPDRIKSMFDKIDLLAFCGHTHQPCVITSNLKCFYPEKCNYQLTLDPKEKYIINVGSVGQPRDRDNRACYLLFNEGKNTIEWRRISYDIETAMKKTEAMCGRESWCALRLMLGR